MKDCMRIHGSVSGSSAVDNGLAVKNAQHLTGSAMPAALVVASYSGSLAEPLAIMEELKGKSSSIQAEDLDVVEQMLIHQAIALQSMFMDLAVRAKGETTLPGMQTLTQLALKAQSGSRATLQTLAELKNPRPVFVRQTNVAHNQQVNNGDKPPPRVENQHAAPIELKAHEEDVHGYPTLDTRATNTAGRANSPDPAVGSVHRAPKRSG
ncbi:MAG: hypothetical protein Q7V16_09495 [Hydrogenophaga sp.]|nr:hypothetical protein [Hydrogenophaga sp.]